MPESWWRLDRPPCLSDLNRRLNRVPPYSGRLGAALHGDGELVKPSVSGRGIVAVKVIDESFSRLTAVKRSAAIVEFGSNCDGCHTRITTGKVLHPTRERVELRSVGFNS